MSGIHISAGEARAVYERIASLRGLKMDDLTSERRSHCLVEARWVIMRELRNKGASLPQIGRLMGLHHSTVLHGLKRESHG